MDASFIIEGKARGRIKNVSRLHLKEGERERERERE